MRLAGRRTRRIDLAGKTVVPGFTDGHAHMDREGLKYVYPSLAGARSIADILEKIEIEVRKARPGEWIVTMPVGDPPFYQNVPGILSEKDRDAGEVLGPEQRMTRQDALRAMTVNGAYLTFEEKIKGSLETGKYADLVVINENYLTIPEDEIKSIRPVMTMVGGRVVYER